MVRGVRRIPPRGAPLSHFFFFKNSVTAIRIKVEIGAPVLAEIPWSRDIWSSSKNVTCLFNFFPVLGTVIDYQRWSLMSIGMRAPRLTADSQLRVRKAITTSLPQSWLRRFRGCNGRIQDSRAFSQGFFRWYKEEHRHSGLGLLSPAMVHYGQTVLILEQRQTVLDVAYRVHPERFVRQAPKPPWVPTEVWINKPSNSDAKTH